MKTIVLMVSKVFPWYHPRKGESTNFKEKILSGEKIHTIRGNYDLWKKRIDQVNAGTHQLVLKQWKDRPYHSSPLPFLTLDKDSGLGVQKVSLHLILNPSIDYCNGYTLFVPKGTMSKNDGLNLVDFESWFIKGKYDLSKPMAIIHFTGFRY